MDGYSYSTGFGGSVPGLLKKSHPKSHIIVSELSDGTYVFDDKMPRIYDESKQEIVVLQVMLADNGNAVVEYVLKEDFNKQ